MLIYRKTNCVVELVVCLKIGFHTKLSQDEHLQLLVIAGWYPVDAILVVVLVVSRIVLLVILVVSCSGGFLAVTNRSI